MSAARPADAGFGCLVLFLLPFAGAGVIAGYQAFRVGNGGDWGQAATLAVFALVFGGVGVGGIAAAAAGRRRLAEAAALEARHPESPWLWRADWAAGRIEDGSRTHMWTAWAFAAFWNLISLPAAVMAVRAAVTEGRTAAWLALVFPLVGAGLLVWAVRTTLRYRRYGISVLELATVPGVVGQSLAGIVRTTSLLQPPDGFLVGLRCIRRVTRGSGKHRSTSETVLWEEERRVRGEPSRTAHGMGMAIPIGFALPRDAVPTDSRNARDQILWRLAVAASVPGVDFESAFEVPVFRTADSDRPRPEGGGMEVEPPAEYRQAPESRIQVTTNRRGTEILFPAARNPGAAAGATLFLALWCGVVAGMAVAGAPRVMIAVFAIVALLVLWGVLELWLGVSRVTVESGEVVLASGYLWPSRERRWPVSEIGEVVPRIGMQAGGDPYYDLVLVRTDGRKVAAGRGIRDKREAEWLAAALERAVRPR